MLLELTEEDWSVFGECKRSIPHQYLNLKKDTHIVAGECDKDTINELKDLKLVDKHMFEECSRQICQRDQLDSISNKAISPETNQKDKTEIGKEAKRLWNDEG